MCVFCSVYVGFVTTCFIYCGCDCLLFLCVLCLMVLCLLAMFIYIFFLLGVSVRVGLMFYVCVFLWLLIVLVSWFCCR